MFSPAKSTVIPNFLVAATPLGLRRLMLFNNKKHGAWLKYEIQWVESKKKWYAWYYAESIRPDDDLLNLDKEEEKA
jgi:hypothetical protein